MLQLVYPDFPFILPAWVSLAAVTVALATGLLFGLLPAIKAAKLDPVQALSRH
jgi:putative ABC transport system permease protein